jgi:hypothetical protein
MRARFANLAAPLVLERMLPFTRWVCCALCAVRGVLNAGSCYLVHLADHMAYLCNISRWGRTLPVIVLLFWFASVTKLHGLTSLITDIP